MITIITGLPGIGKTTRAKQMTDGKKTIWLTPNKLQNPFLFTEMDKDTEFVVIDECKNKNDIYPFVASQKVRIERQGFEAEFIDLPNIIFCIQNITRKDFPNPCINIIDMKTMDIKLY